MTRCAVMDACLATERELEKVLNKFGALKETADTNLDNLIKHLEEIKKNLEGVSDRKNPNELDSKEIAMLSQLSSRIERTVQEIAYSHRELHGTVSKVGKVIDKNFTADFASTSSEQVFAGPEKQELLNRVIIQHFYRQGMLDLGEELIKDANMKIEPENKEPFLELNHILEALKQKNLQPALEWAKRHREKLEQQNSSLEFKLHQLQFIELLNGGLEKQHEAVQYARENFLPFAFKHEKEIQQMMGGLLWLRASTFPPGSNFKQPTLWGEIMELFTRDACTLLGLSVSSPLAICVNAGCMALPALLNIKQVMQQRLVSGMWASKDELPIEIDVGPECRYHSIFACPILRQQTTEANPPMRLVCGHCISRDALAKLTNGNRLKCPYCPMEQNPSDARQIHF